MYDGYGERMIIRKRVLALVTAFAMIIAMVPTFSWADESVQSEELTDIIINPIFLDAVDEDDITDLELDGEPVTSKKTYRTIEEAGAFVRSQMKENEELISFNVDIDGYSGNDYGMFMDIFGEAIRHTGTPDEGDYITWQWAGIGYELYDTDMTIAVRYDTTKAQEDEVDKAVDSILSSLDLEGCDEYTKIKRIYDYMTSNVTYDHDYDNYIPKEGTKEYDDFLLCHTAYAALLDGRAVCQGYALAMYRLLLEEGIDCRLIAGKGNGGDHGWNIAEIDDLYYDLDATWDAGRSEYKYFLRCDENFGDHKRGESYTEDYSSEEFYGQYPMSAKDYHYCAGNHNWGEGIVKTEATCTVDGEISYRCIDCNREKTEAIAAGHDWDEGAVTKRASRHRTGKMTYTCTVCGDTREEVIPATSHNVHTAVSELIPGKKATCKEAGYRDCYVCTVCDNAPDAERYYEDPECTIEIDDIDKWREGEGKLEKTSEHCGTLKLTGKKAATTTSNGYTGDKVCSLCGEIAEKGSTVKKVSSKPTLSYTSCTYTGKVRKPAVTVKDSAGKKLIKDTDYTVSYDRKSVGKATVTVKGKGKYSFEKKLYFKINPKGTSISSLTRDKKAFRVKWKKQTQKMSKYRITGYQIRYSTSSKMTNAKYVTRSGYLNYSKKITKLKSKKKYYVQVRTYRKSGGAKYYSTWSDKKSVTTK